MSFFVNIEHDRRQISDTHDTPGTLDAELYAECAGGEGAEAAWQDP